jgi:hypothetical protein
MLGPATALYPKFKLRYKGKARQANWPSQSEKSRRHADQLPHTLSRAPRPHATVLRVMKSKVERLEEFFGIRIPCWDLRYIRGRGAELGN